MKIKKLLQRTRKTSIVILNWNGWKDTIECLESVFRSEYPDYRVIVCDNASDDGSLEFIKAWAEGRLDALPSIDGPLRHLSVPPVPKPIHYAEYGRAQAIRGEDHEEKNARLILIQNGANMGFGAGNNAGILFTLAREGFDYIWILNNDTRVDPKALDHLIETAERKTNAGAVGSVIYYMNNPEKVQVWGGGRVNLWCGTSHHHTLPAVEAKLHYINGASLLLRRKALEEIGLLDESFFMYWEETDLCFRLRKSGWKLAVAAASKVWHKESASLGRQNPLLYAYFNASAARFFSRHAPIPIVPIVIGLGGRLAKRIIRREWKQARAVLRRRVS